MAFINWSQQGRTIALIIKTPSLNRVHYLNAITDENTHSFPEGIFCNPSLEKKEYLKLVRIYHPDVSEMDAQNATAIVQIINAAKDGHNRTFNPFDSTQYNSPTTKSDPIAVKKALERLKLDGYGWVLERYGENDWKPRSYYDSRFKGEWYEKVVCMGSVTIVVDFIYFEGKAYRPDESIRSLGREDLFLRPVNWATFNVSDLKNILKLEKVPFKSALKKQELTALAQSHFSKITNFFPVSNNLWTYNICRSVDDIFPYFWNDNETIKRAEKQERSDRDFAPTNKLSEWMKRNGKKRIPYNKFKLVIEKAKAIAGEKDPRSWGDDIWQSAWEQVFNGG